MEAMELARRLAALGQAEEACRAYTLALEGTPAPEEEMEAALYILQSGGDYRVSYTCFRELYRRGHFREDCLSVMTRAFYEPNVKALKKRYEKNCKLLSKYPYLFRKDFPDFETLPIRFYPYDEKGYLPFFVSEERFGDYMNPKDPVVSRNFFKDLENPILADDVFSQYELEYLNDNVRDSERVGRENHIYLHYTNWAEFCAYLQCWNLRPLLDSKKLVFLMEDEIGLYPIDFKERFRIDYSQYKPQPLSIREVTRMIWHGQLSTHNGGDFFNEVFDAHPNLITMASPLMSDVEESVACVRTVLEDSGSLAEAQERLSAWENPRLVEELYHSRARTDKDILVALFLRHKRDTQFLDEASRIAPALFFQPHFRNIHYAMQSDAGGQTELYSEEYEKLRTSPIFLGFQYIKTFVPIRRPTTSHGATVRFMNWQVLHSPKDGKKRLMGDELSERVLNRSFMADREDRLCRDGVIVRFEDGKLNPKATFTALAAFLDLPYTESMTYCSDQGERNPHPETKGFDPAPVYKTYDEFINDSERIFIEYFLRDAYACYGYDFHYYDGSPMTRERMEELLKHLDTIDGYIGKARALAADQEEAWRDGVKLEEPEAIAAFRRQTVDHHIQSVRENRRAVVDVLMNDLRFVNRRGQPLYMMPMLEPDPALLEQPLYH